MGKGSRNRRKQKRLQAKRARKAANRAEYESRKFAGINNKSKRSLLAAKKKKLRPKFKHAVANCGNIGCKKCNHIYFK